MNIFKYLIVFSLAVLIGCSSDENPIEEPDPDPVTGDPVETNSPNTDYSPAFEGQTRIGSVTTTTKIKHTVLTSQLTSPWDIVAMPDDRFLVTQRTGNMRIVTNTGTISNPITGTTPGNTNGQGGLLGVCLDPQFSTNKMIYWVFSEKTDAGDLTAVAKGKLSDDESKIENVTVIYRAEPRTKSDLHYGGRILFDANGYLLVSTGERSILSTRPLAQSVTAALGKIVRITTDGQPAPGNPNFGGDALPELYSMGHRNPQGLAIHPTTGDLWQSEHGPRGGDEINRVVAGSNYGWPTITYGIEYSGEAIGGAIQKQDGLQQPVYYWDPVISPSGMTFYKGNNVPEWENNLFIGSLSGQHIARLVINSDNEVVGEERLLAAEGQRFRDVTQGNDNALYAITDSGRLYKIDKE